VTSRVDDLETLATSGRHDVEGSSHGEHRRAGEDISTWLGKVTDMHDDVDHHRADADKAALQRRSHGVRSCSSCWHMGSSVRLFTVLTSSTASVGNAWIPWQAPAMAPTMAAIVSLSPPSEAARRHTSHARPSSPARRTAKAAGTDSWVATLVPTTCRV